MDNSIVGLNALADSFFLYRKQIILIKLKIFLFYFLSVFSLISIIVFWKILDVIDVGEYKALTFGIISILFGSASLFLAKIALSKRTMLKILRKRMLEIFESVFCLRKIIKKDNDNTVLLNAIDFKLFLIDPNV
jgi:hypothetical protein